MSKTTGNVIHEVQYLANNDKRQEAKDVIEQYAQEIAVEFAERVGDLYYKSTDGYWFEKGHKDNLDPDPTPYSTSQLFQQFLTNKNEKK